MPLSASSSALRYGGNSEPKLHFEKLKPVVSPAFQPKPAAVSPWRLKPPSRQVLGMMSVSTKLRCTP